MDLTLLYSSPDDGILKGPFEFIKEWTYTRISWAAGINLTAILIGILIASIVIRNLRKSMAEPGKTPDALLKSLARSIFFFPVLIGLFITEPLMIPNDSVQWAYATTFSLLGLNTGWFLWILLDIIISRLPGTEKEPAEGEGQGIISGVRLTIRCFILAGTVTMIIQSFDNYVSPFMVVIWGSAFAIGFASKDILSNLFNSLAILTSKPFGIGDVIKSDRYEGTVEEINYRSTGIRTDDDTLVFIPNSLFMNQQVENISRARRMRVNSTIYIAPDSHQDRIDKALEWIRKVIQTHPDTSKGSIQVYLSQFTGEHIGITFEFFIETVRRDKYNAARQELLRSILKAIFDAGLKQA